MAIEWHIYINGTEVEQPVGISEMVLKVTRDDLWHGIFFEAATSALGFYGTGADLLKAEKQANGLAAAATFRAEAVCGEEVDLLEGSFDFGTYNEKCGNECLVEIGIEKKGCIMTLRNRYDQKVDLSKATAMDNMTLLPNYAGLSFPLQLLAQKIVIGNEAHMSDINNSEIITGNGNWLASDGLDNYIGYISPALPNVTNASFGTFSVSPITELAGPLEGVPNRPPYPSFPIGTGTADLPGYSCNLTDTEVEFRLKGSGTVVFSGSAAVSMNIKLFRLPLGLDGSLAANWVQEYTALLYSETVSGTVAFDTGVVTVPLTVTQGDFIYFGLSTRGSSLANIDHFELTFHPETYYKLESSAECTPTEADVSLVNETGSRIIEAITDSCMQLKSDYYGRTDSQPFSSSADGCGGLRVLSNGLKIRQATPDNHFISLQDFFMGLRAIDNIGMGIENDPIPYVDEWVRIEPVRYFYQNIKLLTIDLVPEAENSLQPDMGVSKIMVGYQKWEVERVNGLNEFNSNKEFRTSLKTIDKPLDILSNFIAGGIPIEVTRQESFAVTGQADTKYDDETFIICVTRTGQYSVTFEAATNRMYFQTSGNGNEFLLPNITIAGSVSNNGTRAIFAASLTSMGSNLTLVEIQFSGGTTIDEVSNTVTFTGIVSSGYFVEKGNIDNPANIFSPDTAYNWRIRPMYNLMRWFKSIAHVYVNLVNSTSKLFFSAGTGNYLAEGELPAGDDCKIENKVLAENDDLDSTDFSDTNDSTPIFKPEIITFTYPLSIRDYLVIKNNPYGYIDVQCGTGGYEKCFIKSLEYKPVKGDATFTLIKKWQQ